MAEWAVVDSSPLIFLSKADSLDFLRLAASEVVVPESVAEEIRRRGPEDVTARALAETAWLHVTPDPPIPSVIEHWDLGPGESAVLAHARERPGTIAIIDDGSGRRCAEVLGIPLNGTLGLVMTAKWGPHTRCTTRSDCPEIAWNVLVGPHHRPCAGIDWRIIE